ncbi:glutathione S-transferase family protein [Hyphomicrobium sp.]|uniref:glutathione S-transferase family protein n=1 Tax=Hyphomicrobium sp. TaxID=82 RepID=UPI0025BAB93D|nr:glutathione S-transferase family protein [Hyphomicrobium sp.]MCC7251717.1 glutathione S-transferase family protein [Hyphomicrobium sp.]
MITLYLAGPKFGLPDASPFCTKADVLLKMSGVPYRTAQADFGKAPKRKIPYFDDDGHRFSDTTFLRFHLEEKHGVDFDKNLGAREKAGAWAFEKMAEDQVYWALLDARWTDKANFDKGPRAFFEAVPAPLRAVIVPVIRRSVARDLRGQGFGRHTKDEIKRLTVRALDAISTQIGDRPWLMGDAPCGADASVWAMLTGLLCPHFETPIRTAAERYANLTAYRDRGLALWYPDLAAA